ncbi:hypothetical protein CSKR_112408 [Clonorchis sinensis]|uniref:Zinc finger protein 878 n=2 Tax=Clonorchis sinensis TaxID=79923 RepID=H2KPZ9_CLOSI|nr:hypothetical protein CSKR_112408 [Clonorchis sinensis]GAA32050.2 zinc finger protein 878 [Clonorchis sinensis]
MKMGLRDTGPLFTHVSEPADCSSSSCPPSATTSEESGQEGYLILTFDKSKRARLKTAIFADVSDCRFADDFDEDGVGDEDSELLYNWPNNSDSDVTKANPVIPPAPSVTSENDLTPSSDDATHNDSGCYGEAVWVGHGEATENELQPVPVPNKSTTPANLPTETHRLIRTSPITKRMPENLCVVRAPQLSPAKSTNDPRSIRPSLSDSFRLSPRTPVNGVRIEPVQQRPLGVSVRWTNRLLSKSGFPHYFPPSSKLRSSGFLHTGFSSSTGSYTDDCEPGDEKYPRKMLRCDACGKYYRNEYSLHHHICLRRKDVWKKGDVPSDVVDGQLVYFCPTCHKPFKWLGNLTRHFYVHTGQRFFKCDICSKEFFSAYQVKRHMNSHTGRRFKCEVCDKPFTCKYACAWHTRQHYTYAE